MAKAGERILVTGATGIIGRHAVANLVAQGAEVHAVARDSLDQVPLQGAHIHRLDLLDRPATQALLAEIRPDILLHLAWITGHGRFWNAPENLDWLASSIYLIRGFVDAGGRRVVVAGTCAEYDPAAGHQSPLPETAPCHPQTLYGWAKHALHRVLAAYAEQVGLSYGWGRLFLLYGEDEPAERLAPSVVKAVLAGQPAKCSHGLQIRDFLDTRDAGAAFAALALSDVEGPVNICSGQPISVADFATRLALAVGRPDLLQLGALPDRPNDPPYLVGDPGRLNADVGFRPAVALEAGLNDTIARLRQQPGGRE